MGLSAYQAHYGAMPQALFVTHVHLDHVAGFERLFVDAYFSARHGQMWVYLPAPVLRLLHRCIVDYPLTEGGTNFWSNYLHGCMLVSMICER